MITHGVGVTSTETETDGVHLVHPPQWQLIWETMDPPYHLSCRLFVRSHTIETWCDLEMRSRPWKRMSWIRTAIDLFVERLAYYLSDGWGVYPEFQWYGSLTLWLPFGILCTGWCYQRPFGCCCWCWCCCWHCCCYCWHCCCCCWYHHNCHMLVHWRVPFSLHTFMRQLVWWWVGWILSTRKYMWPLEYVTLYRSSIKNATTNYYVRRLLATTTTNWYI